MFIYPNINVKNKSESWWINNIKVTTDSIHIRDKKCFQYPVTVVLNHEEIKKGLQRITKIKPFINKYDREGMNFPSRKDDLKKCGKNNVTIALNVLHAKR